MAPKLLIFENVEIAEMKHFDSLRNNRYLLCLGLRFASNFENLDKIASCEVLNDAPY